jgi:hypothetical protein
MKTWYTSKTLWINIIAAIALVVQTQIGFVIDPEAQAGLLTLINIVLRLITSTPLNWSTPPASGGDPEAGFINLRLLVELFLVMFIVALLCAGCATTGTAPQATDTPQITAGKSLLAVKSGIVVAATSVDRLCTAHVLTTETCTKAKTAYEQSKIAYDAAVDAYLLMSAQGGDPAAFGAALIRVQDLAKNLLLIATPPSAAGGPQ